MSDDIHCNTHYNLPPPTHLGLRLATHRLMLGYGSSWFLCELFTKVIMQKLANLMSIDSPTNEYCCFSSMSC